MTVLHRVIVLSWTAWWCAGAAVVGVGWSAWTLWWSQKYGGDNVGGALDGRTRSEYAVDRAEQSATLLAGSLALFAVAFLLYWLSERLDSKTPRPARDLHAG